MKIRRHILNDLLDHLLRKEITLITGPRQAGKTTLMKELIGEIIGAQPMEQKLISLLTGKTAFCLLR